MEVIGKYRIIRKLAHGGMAEIYLARHVDAEPDSAPVVIKQILHSLAHDERFVAMFLNEAQLAAHMHHDNIVEVLEFGEADGLLYMAMEFVDGLDGWRFAKRSADNTAGYVGVAVYVLRRVLDALEYAHNLKDVNGENLAVVHRDLSLSNIYLSKIGQVKLGDFGIARIESNRFRPVQIKPKGKFGYMAPEQIEGRNVDKRADVYSAGVVLAELLIRQQLFRGSSRLSVARDIKDGRLEQLEKNVEKIPIGLRSILEGSLAKNPDDRYRSAAEFNEALMVFEQTSGQGISRLQFANQVQRILRKVEDEQNRLDVSSDIEAMARTMAGEEILGLQVTRPDVVTAGAVKTLEDFDKTPTTLDFEQLTDHHRYWAKLDDDVNVGPTAFAHIIELIYSDKITPWTMMSKEGRHFVEARNFEELVRHLPAYTPRTGEEHDNTPKMRGLFDIETPSNIMLLLVLNAYSGVLLCETQGHRKDIYLDNGYVIYAGSNESSELLGEYLVENGVLERVELEMALALLPKFQGHLGDTLIALGMMTAVDLFLHITGQITKRIEELLFWDKGQYEFFEGVGVRKGVLTVKLDILTVVSEHLSHRVSRLKAEDIFNDLSNFNVCPSGLCSSIAQKLKIPADIISVIQSIATWTKVDSLLSDNDDQFKGEILFIAIESGLWKCDAPSLPW